jgi:hypothetical protein
MRAHFTICAKRPAASDHVDRRRRSSKVKRECLPGRRMLPAGGAQFAASRMRAHFTERSRRPWA